MGLFGRRTAGPGWIALPPRPNGAFGYIIDFRHDDHPHAVMWVLLFACDLDDGNTGILAEPNWLICDDPGSRYRHDNTVFAASTEILTPLLDVSHDPSDHEAIAEALAFFAGLIAEQGQDAFSHPAFEGIFTPELLGQMFAWDGQLFDWDEEQP